jgi:hypothetical protein
MPNDDPKLVKWWDGLSKEERKEAKAAAEKKNGHLSPGLVKSLQDAGELPDDYDVSDPIPKRITTFLKARHDV